MSVNEVLNAYPYRKKNEEENKANTIGSIFCFLEFLSIDTEFLLKFKLMLLGKLLEFDQFWLIQPKGDISCC